MFGSSADTSQCEGFQLEPPVARLILSAKYALFTLAKTVYLLTLNRLEVEVSVNITMLYSFLMAPLVSPSVIPVWKISC